MNQKTWSAVDEYFNNTFMLSDSELDNTIKESDTAGLPKHNVTQNQGKGH